MAKAFTGKDGRLLIDGLEQIKVASWSLTGDLEMLETTTLGDQQRTYVPGVQGFTGNASLLYYSDDTGRNDAATALRKVLRVNGVSEGDTVSLVLRLIDGAANKDVQFFAYITNVSFGVNVGDVSRAEISFQATGSLSAVTL